MAPITHVCISDLHLGARTSLLTELDIGGEPKYGEASSVHDALVACLRDLLSTQPRQLKPTLVLAGDVLELALAPTHEAAMCFERFLLELFPGGGRDLFSRRVLLVPGNHDHHLWDSARDQHYVDFLRTIPSTQALEPAWSVTRLYAVEGAVEWPRSALLNALAHRHTTLRDLSVELPYPNFGLCTPDGARSVVFTHGHFIEPNHLAMSTLRNLLFPEQQRVATIANLERENAAWIELFWAAMAGSGAIGDGMQRVYEIVTNPDGVENIAERVTMGVVKHWGRALVPDAVEQLAIRSFVHTLFENAVSHERSYLNEPLSVDMRRGLDSYISGPLRRQIIHERRHQGVPTQLSVVFGHTHKPFEGHRTLTGFAAPVAVLNTGGWVVDTSTPQPLHGGAIVVVDEQLNCASLRMYNEPERHGTVAPVWVAAAGGDDFRDNPLAEGLARHIEASQRTVADPWAGFSEAVEASIEQRAWVLTQRGR